jgi:pimeloyl-ACP methyl ester carboxylesterase
MKGLVALAAGLAAGVVAEQLAVRKPWRPDPTRNEPFGSVRGQPHWVRSDDGTELYVEVHPAPAAAPTVVFGHGYCLNQDSWHFQRKALEGTVRMVLWDQRGHGRSRRGPAANNTLDQLGRDLHAVLTAHTEGPVTLVGHSMGGMTIMAMADQFPETVAQRVNAVGLVATSCGNLSADFLGVAPGAARRIEAAVAGRQPGKVPMASLIQAVRRTDLNFAATRRASFGSHAPLSLNRFTMDMLNGTPLETALDFLPTLLSHDKYDALRAFADLPAVVTCGRADVLTPPSHTLRIAEQLPDAAVLILPDTGHMIQLERPTQITRGIADLAFAGRAA